MLLEASRPQSAYQTLSLLLELAPLVLRSLVFQPLLCWLNLDAKFGTAVSKQKVVEYAAFNDYLRPSGIHFSPLFSSFTPSISMLGDFQVKLGQVTAKVFWHLEG